MQEHQLLIVCLGLILFVVCLLFLPINIKLKLYVNFEDLKAYYSIKILFIKLLCGEIKIEDNKLVFCNIHNKIIKQNKEEQKKEGLFIRQIAKNINTHKLDLIFEFGSNDASISALVCGYAQMIFSLVCSHVLVYSKYAHVFEGVVTNYKQQTCQFTMQLILGINIIKIIKSKIVANKMHMENSYGK